MPDWLSFSMMQSYCFIKRVYRIFCEEWAMFFLGGWGIIGIDEKFLLEGLFTMFLFSYSSFCLVNSILLLLRETKLAIDLVFGIGGLFSLVFATIFPLNFFPNISLSNKYLILLAVALCYGLTANAAISISFTVPANKSNSIGG